MYRKDAKKFAPGVQDITEKALRSGGAERMGPNKSISITGESKVPFSQGLVPRKATTMPKPKWHAPWKLMRVSDHSLSIYFLYLDIVIIFIYVEYLSRKLLFHAFDVSMDFTLKYQQKKRGNNLFEF